MLNPFFQQGARSEQNLVQDLINEQLRMYGVEVHYMPRKYVEENKIIREVVQSKFDDAYPLEAYVDTFDGYGENPVLLTKFGIEATNEITLTISKERFVNDMNQSRSNFAKTLDNFKNKWVATVATAENKIHFLGDKALIQIRL